MIIILQVEFLHERTFRNAQNVYAQIWHNVNSLKIIQ